MREEYDTSKSNKIAEYYNGESGIKYYGETLFRTSETDEYWLLCEGGSLSGLATYEGCGNWSGGTRVCSLSGAEDAYTWACIRFDDERAHELIYGNVD